MGTTNSTADSSKEKLNQAYNLAGEAAAETSQQFKESAQEKVAEGKQKATEMAGKAESSIRENPLISVGCAFVAGLAIAKILK